MLSRLVAGVFPLTCPGCGRAAEPLCASCAASLRAPTDAVPPVGVDAWYAPFVYEGVARELVARVKYRGAHAVTAWLASAMVVLVAPPMPAVVTWVPTTSARMRERGFDHAELLARQVARRMARPVSRVLIRTAGPSQTDLRGAARRRGPLIEAVRPAAAHVLLVDDVATTGSSLSAAAAALRANGADRVDALTAARTPLSS